MFDPDDILDAFDRDDEAIDTEPEFGDFWQEKEDDDDWN